MAKGAKGRHGPGGARRKPSPIIDPAELHTMLSAYISQETLPFFFDVYDQLKPSQAASGPGLLQTVSFMNRFLAICPECQLSTKQFSSTLEGLVQSGSMSRFAGAHQIWERLSPYDTKQRGFWCSKQTAKVVVILYHWRRLKTIPQKKVQAFSSLSKTNQTELELVLKKIVVPSPKASETSLTLSTHQSPQATRETHAAL